MRKGELSFARCELCLGHDGWAKTTDNLMLADIGGRETLVCRHHNPNKKLRGAYEEPESIGD